MIKNLFLFFAVLGMFATLSQSQVSSVTGQYLQDNNLLLNPGFESGIGKWTNSAGTFTADYSVFVQGKASGKVVLSSQALNFFQDSTLFASQLADGMQAILTVKIKSSVAGVRVCPRQAGSVITSLCIDVQGNNKWGLYQIPFVTGATSQGISINSNGNSITGTVYVDESYVGVSNILNSSSEAKLAGEAYFAGTAGCTWSRTSTTIGAFGTVAACPGPTISYQSLGQWQTTDSDLPRVTVNNLPAGVYKATFHVWVSMVATQVPALSINDGTTSCYPIYSEQSSLAASSQVVSCTFTYTGSGNRIFELYGASNTSTINISNPSYTPAASGTKFQLEYYGSNSTYTTTAGINNVDVFSANISSGGVVTAENVDWINGNCTAAGTQNTCTFNSNIFTVAPNCTIGKQSVGEQAAVTTLTTLTLSYWNSAGSGGAKTGSYISCQKQGADFVASKTITVSFNEVMTTPGIAKPILCSAKISSTGAISDQKGNCFASCTNATTPVCTFTSNFWVSGTVPNCWHRSTASWFLANGITTTTTFQGILWSSGAAAQSGSREYFCHGELQ